MATTTTNKSKRTSSTPARKTARQTTRKAVPVTTDQIRTRAFEIYLERGAAGGDALQDWLQAEQELTKV